jgi:hypothetical protein
MMNDPTPRLVKYMYVRRIFAEKPLGSDGKLHMAPSEGKCSCFVHQTLEKGPTL